MSLNISAFDNVLKDWYEGAIRETLNNDVPLYKHLESSDKQWSGRRSVYPVHTSRNTGVGSRAEGANLPTAGNQSYQLAVVSATYLYGRGQVSGQVVAAGKNAFADALQSELTGLSKDLTIECSRQSWGTGDGRLAQIAAAVASSTSITVFNRYNTTGTKFGSPGARFVVAGQLLDIGTVADPDNNAANAVVISVALSSSPGTVTDTVTISNSAFSGSACESYLFNASAGGIGPEMLGMQALIDVYTQANYFQSNSFLTTVQGISRASVAQWNSIVLANSGVARILDGNLMQLAFDQMHQESGKEPGMIMAHHDVVRAFLDSVSADRRYASPSFDAGMSGLSYNGVPLERDRHAPYNACYLWVKGAIKQFTLLDTEFADDDGSILSRVANQDNWEFFVRRYANLGIDSSPKEMLAIRDIRTDL